MDDKLEKIVSITDRSQTLYLRKRLHELRGGYYNVFVNKTRGRILIV